MRKNHGKGFGVVVQFAGMAIHRDRDRENERGQMSDPRGSTGNQRSYLGSPFCDGGFAKDGKAPLFSHLYAIFGMWFLGPMGMRGGMSAWQDNITKARPVGVSAFAAHLAAA